MSDETQAITEVAPGVWRGYLYRCALQQADRIVVPDPATHIWIPSYRPHPSSSWAPMQLPLDVPQPAQPLTARFVTFELQMPLPRFLELLPSMHAWSGALVAQLGRPVPDNLLADRVFGRPNEHHILRQLDWRLTLRLSHDGDTAEVITGDRAHLERVLADPGLLSGAD